MARYRPWGSAGRDRGSQETSTRRNSRDDYESARDRASTTQRLSGGQQSYDRMEDSRGAVCSPKSLPPGVRRLPDFYRAASQWRTPELQPTVQ